mmetsp:Transcript_148897/g.476874  ORF Transcript_148897/g.476874 Transcript_148897/m.476874 type:complete len:165 (-) Transcript_148897:159-653(-)
MRSTKHMLQGVRKGRKFGSPSSSAIPTCKGGGKGRVEFNKKNKDAKLKSKCFDCDEVEHWAGGIQCKKPGAGSGKKQAHLTENENDAQMVDWEWMAVESESKVISISDALTAESSAYHVQLAPAGKSSSSAEHADASGASFRPPVQSSADAVLYVVGGVIRATM